MTGQEMYEITREFTPHPQQNWQELSWDEQDNWNNLAVEQAARDNEEN